MKSSQSMNVSIFGLGYVGCVSLGCIALAGHHVLGVDINEQKVEQVRNGQATIFEPGLDELIRDVHRQGRISATSSVEEAVLNTEVSIVTVGTPRKPNGDLELKHILSVSEQIGQILRKADHHHSIAIRSTVRPGTCNQIKEIIEHHSGKKAGNDFSVVANPEFLREGTAIKDYLNPPYVLIGADHPGEAEKIAAVYSTINAETIIVSLGAAEIIKYVNNSWHALKVAFGNEVGSVCKALQIDSHEVMDIFIRDRQLNISPYYLRPGFAYGGSCLPKDLSAFNALAQGKEIQVPVLQSIKTSNDKHIQRAIELIQNQKSRKLSFLGLTFKSDTDDVRNSPVIEVIKSLDKDDYDIRIYDEAVSASLETGRNSELQRVGLGPLVDRIVSTPKELLEHSQLVVVAKNDEAIRQILSNSDGITIVDLVSIGPVHCSNRYIGLAW